MASCLPSSGFPNSDFMGKVAVDQSVVWEEINKIQQAILEASSQCQTGGGKFCTIVSGTTPMTFVAGITGITVVSGGSGYYEDSPQVEFIPPNGSLGSGAVGTVTTNGGKIISITVTNPGSGYQPKPSTMSVSSSGSGAVLTPLVNGVGQIASVAIQNPGTGYSISDTVTATRAVLPNVSYVDATFKITSVGVSGEILGVSVLNPGTGYQDSVATVKLVSTLNPLMTYPLGAGFSGTVLTDLSGAITQVVVNNGGVGYAVYPPYLNISNPGFGAITKVNLTGTTVSSVDVIYPGSNYVPTPTGTIYNPITAGVPNPPITQAEVTIQFRENLYDTDPTAYYKVFTGTLTSKQLSTQMNTVISYFKKLGYSITRQPNPATGTTIQWKVCW